MEKLGFYYNMNTCVACGACQVACKDIHNLKAGEFFRRVAVLDDGPYSGACNHCENAACVDACPTGAMYKAVDGTTQHDDGKCIGCGACMWNCPYGAVSFSKSRGVSQKCDSCKDRRDCGLTPACVSACPTSSIKFGPLEEVMADMDFLPDSAKTRPCLYINRPKVNPASLRSAADAKGGNQTHE